jgi:hypothetical protein
MPASQLALVADAALRASAAIEDPSIRLKLMNTAREADRAYGAVAGEGHRRPFAAATVAELEDIVSSLSALPTLSHRALAMAAKAEAELARRQGRDPTAGPLAEKFLEAL